MKYLEEIDYRHPEFGDLYDELPLWSAFFGLLLLNHVPIRQGITILDVGSGTGFITLELAQCCGSETEVIAVDPWHAGMDRLRKKLVHLGLTNVTLLEQDAADINLPNESVDLIVSNLGINNFENIEAVLQTLYRVAKPKASLFLTTNLEGHMAEFYEVFRATLIELGQDDWLDILENHVRKRGTIESISRNLDKAGFKVVDTIADSFRIRFATGSSFLNHYFIRLAFIQDWKSIVTSDTLQTTFKTLERNLNKVAEENGELVLTIPMALIEARK